jgi:hypothetical protein
MIEALRGLGYSTGAALADIIDNSIAARATTVDVRFVWKNGHASIAVQDNGHGMDDGQLERAMRLGQLNPLADRGPEDLGRFGMGLKTASFSQCRRLTVASRRNGEQSCLRWDLDVLAEAEGDGWMLLEGPAADSSELVGSLELVENGTIVLWEKLDRIVTAGFTEQNFLDLIDDVERHLAMVFHRFLQGPRPALMLSINGRSVQPWDPFLADNSATWSSPPDRVVSPGGTVEVQCYVLPHKDRLSQGEYDRAAGPHGWTAQQGFYIYRNRRLLVAGSWLGLGRGRSWTKEESHRLARIRVDLPNTADFAWKLDIRKSSARPPVEIRDRLTRLAEDTRERARRVFAHRGQPSAPGRRESIAQAWRVEHFAGGVRYRVDESHEAVKAVLEDAGPLRDRIDAMLRVIEATLPVQRIWLDTVEAQDTPRTGFSGQPPQEVAAILMVMYRNIVQRRGVDPALAREQLLRTEPFHQYPELVLGLPDDPSETE